MGYKSLHWYDFHQLVGQRVKFDGELFLTGKLRDANANANAVVVAPLKPNEAEVLKETNLKKSVFQQTIWT